MNLGGAFSGKHASELKAASTELKELIIQNRIEEGFEYAISEFKTIRGDDNITGYIH